MRFWIFKCNPDFYRLNDRLADQEPRITWLVSGYKVEISAGDIAFIWETGVRRIRGIMEISDGPREMLELEHEQQYLTKPDRIKKLRVCGRLDSKRDVCISHTELRPIPSLENLSMFHGNQQGTNFPVEQKEGEIIQEMIMTFHNKG
jgi:hypothetical protein